MESDSAVLLNINPSSGVPIYRQIVEQVAWMIGAGQLRPGDELPSVREIARRFSVNPMTVSKAYSQMEADGMVERQRGKPMRVRASAASREPLAKRIDRLEGEIRQLISGARQLNVPDDKLLDAVRRHLQERSHEYEDD